MENFAGGFMKSPEQFEQVMRPSTDPGWILREEGFDALLEGSRTTRFAISNGFLGVRGARALPRGGRWVGTSRTLIAGLFETAGEEPGSLRLAAAPDWMKVRILLQGEPLINHIDDASGHERILDMRRGAVLGKGCLSNASEAGVRLRSFHMVSLSQRAIGMQIILLETDQGGIDVTLQASIDAVDIDLLSVQAEHGLSVWRAQSSGRRLAVATAVSLQIDRRLVASTECGLSQWSWKWTSCPGQVICLARTVAMTRAGRQEGDPVRDAQDALESAQILGWPAVVAAHEKAWESRWACSDVEVEGDPAAQQALRFALFHLNGAANPADEHVSIAARALTGDDHHGHVLWDTEIYLLPFYTLTWPRAARALLMYRFHTLAGARKKAASMGWQGALYAWESADTGAETCPSRVVGPDLKLVVVNCGMQEQHISADIGYAVWQYWQITGDDAFLLEAGAEILLETARFWASRAQLESDGRCHIRGVIGPDEYHQSIDDNAFTNVMARSNIRRALETAALLHERWPQTWGRLAGQLKLDEAELKRWGAVADAMATGFDSSTGLFEQFAGYFALEDIDVAAYAGRSVPIDVVLGRERTQRSQVVKQADVVALLALMPQEFPGDAAARNFEYYASRCGHDSSLSRAMHGIVAARLGDTGTALDFFRNTSSIDLDDGHAAIEGGVHIASLGGIWMMAVFGFAGLSFGIDHLALAPMLPDVWKSLSFAVQWRNRYLKIEIVTSPPGLHVSLEAGDPMKILLDDEMFTLGRTEPVRVTRKSRASSSDR
ncbi:glycoside hydrolase family 65 protein [Paraburkholderia sp. BCC1886]|uniref:glycoside hydrolase family 65 protein n=1 Tax=Paraburkholderia sp. BCC1886 TaxID=2562670 RepID=UPI0021B19996|nr:glycosyl hydrolase family 65 protein [Paraburkholderia sp. BCC1886]